MIGIIPAAGKAERMGGIPKMLLPTPNGTLISLLCSRMERVGQVIVGTRPVIYEALAGVCNALVYRCETATMSETVLTARQYIMAHETVCFGMPDTYFDDANAFVKLAAELKDGADLAVGVFQTRPEQRHKLGMVELTPGDEVLRVVEKPAETSLTWAWGVLAWKPRFWQYIEARDPHVGYALPRALAAELDVRAVRMDGGFWDCGTPDEYFDLITHLHSERIPF
jgi:NDP-sugar pyrophosphorylase family protein